ncbi:MAG: FkbM family methyltransferase [Candidatus Binatia bacterium]
MRKLEEWSKPAIRKLRTWLEPRSHGTWLYSQDVVSWLYKPPFKQQLPAPYRLFAEYCGFQRHRGKRSIIGGEAAFHSVIWLNKFIGLGDYARLELGSHTVFLDLYDPRMLQVPNELLCSASRTATLGHFLSEGDTFVDVGANHGSFSIIAAKLVGQTGLVIAIEPQPRLAHLVEKSLAANAQCEYQVHGIACGDKDGHADFYIPMGSSGSAGLLPGFSATHSHRKLSVPLKRFDDVVAWLRLPGKVFIKLDVEGSELAFLRGASSTILLRKPHIMLEINPSSTKAAGVTGDDLVCYLLELGYEHFVQWRAPTERKPLRKLETSRPRNVVIIPQA